MTTESDPRPVFLKTLDQATAVIAGVKADQLSDPTPCTEYDVAAVINHVTAAVERMGLALSGQDTPELEATSAVPEGGFDEAFAVACDKAREAIKDDSLLGQTIVLPWATLTGAVVISVYGLEAVLHAWDIAVSTGQEALLDDDLASAVRPIADDMLMPEHRGGEMPFAEVVEIEDDARPVHKLAAFSGRKRP